MKDLPRIDCAIIGGGPGGLLSALYLRRFGRSVLLVQAGEPRAQWIPRIRNLVGHPDGLTGPELLTRIRRQVMHCRPLVKEGLAQVERRGRKFLVSVNHECYLAEKVILATGIEDIEPPFTNYRKLRARGLLAYCPICDGPDHCHDRIGLLVMDNQGLEKVKFLCHFSKDLHVIAVAPFRVSAKHRREMEERRVHYYDFPIRELAADGKELAIKFAGHRSLRVKLAYVELGAKVRDHAFRELRGLKRTKEGFIVTSYHQETSVPGMYAVGDCVNALAQVSVAAGHAAIAATRVHNELGFKLTPARSLRRLHGPSPHSPGLETHP